MSIHDDDVDRGREIQKLVGLSIQPGGPWTEAANDAVVRFLRPGTVNGSDEGVAGLNKDVGMVGERDLLSGQTDAFTCQRPDLVEPSDLAT